MTRRGPPPLELPKDVEAERALVGACLMGDAPVIGTVSAIVKLEDFWSEDARACFGAMQHLRDRGEGIDFRTVAGELDNGHAPYLIDCLGATPTWHNASTYARRIVQCALRRKIILRANELARIALVSDAETPEDLLSRIAPHLEAIGETPAPQTAIVTSKQAATWYSEFLDRRQQGDPEAVGIALGMGDLDRVVAYRPGELWYVAASPGVGKTTLLSNMQEKLSAKGHASLFVSLEQPLVQLMDRTLAADTSIDSWRIATGRLDESDWERINKALAKRYEQHGLIVDSPTVDTAQLATLVHRAKAKHQIRVVYVDYVQLLADEAGDGSEYLRISYISRHLAQIARQQGVCVVAACQVTKQGSERPELPPRLNDLRDSGRLAQDAFVVLGIGRGEGSSVVDIAVRKNRNGPQGHHFRYHFAADTLSFLPLARTTQ